MAWDTACCLPSSTAHIPRKGRTSASKDKVDRTEVRHMWHALQNVPIQCLSFSLFHYGSTFSAACCPSHWSSPDLVGQYQPKVLEDPRTSTGLRPGRTVRVNVTRISNLGPIWPNFRGKFDWRCKNPGTWLPDCSRIGGQYFSFFSHRTSCVHPKTRR
jgi:hypothetical protein